jgi:hypothetical protein
MGQERFASLLYHRPGDFGLHLFTPERFADIQRGDCLYDSLDQCGDWNYWHAKPSKLADMECAVIWGDKAPHLYEQLNVFGAADWIDRDVTIFFMVRDVRGVATSYELRRADPSDSWTDDQSKAVTEWSRSVTLGAQQLTYRRGRFRLCFVRYEAVFERGLESMLKAVERLYEELDIPFGEVERNGVEKVHEYGQQRQEWRRQMGIKARVDDLISAEAAHAYERILNLSLFL